ncbi:hypothetical protein RhiirA5_412142 [Rhizophagus irregularis]|uniref:Uncharacterized protein n=1 Tax=Rhizophagus irregularis TaxID=588596 RepID=A0A2I1EF75_9GLOM|nr:hypothetical protein RhiirA5_412142 [Rhizophagus irregularis]PKY20767.1 hypothetical protein RhiirB3_434154 [Rhizophagus irregularis]
MERWNRLTRSNLNLTHPHLLTETTNPRTSARYAATFIKQLQHSPINNRIPYVDQRLHKRKAYQEAYKRGKNWLHRKKRRDRLKKQLPPIPPEILDRRKYNVDSIPQYNVTYTMARNLHLYKYPFPSCVVIEDVTQQANANASYSISDKDRQFLTRPDVFLHRTPPVDKDNKSDMSDESFKSAMDMPMEITPPPTPAHN